MARTATYTGSKTWPRLRTSNPWYQLDRDRLFAYGANYTEKSWDLAILNSNYSQPDYMEPITCSCGQNAWLRETVGAPQCPSCRALPWHARSLDKIEAEAATTTDEARLAELRIEWKNRKLHG